MSEVIRCPVCPGILSVKTSSNGFGYYCSHCFLENSGFPSIEAAEAHASGSLEAMLERLAYASDKVVLQVTLNRLSYDADLGGPPAFSVEIVIQGRGDIIQTESKTTPRAAVEAVLKEVEGT